MDVCSKCNKQRMYANRTKKLCLECNTIRLHGKGTKELQEEKTKKWNLKKIDRELTKEGKAKSNYYNTLNILTSKGEFRVCSGCGSNQYLYPSHLVRRSLRKDLEAEELNIRSHCIARVVPDKFKLKGCDARYESGVAEQWLTMLDFKENLERVKQLDKGEYNRMILILEKWENRKLK